jgi:hypothetical protein
MGLEKGLEKLFEEDGEVEGFKGIADLQEGVPKEVSFTSTVTGEDNKFPNGEDGGWGTMTRHADGTVDVSYKGSLKKDKDQIVWRSHEMSKVEGGKLRGLEIVTGFSQRIIIMETEIDLHSNKFHNTAYEWK